jgi:acetyl esterase
VHPAVARLMKFGMRKGQSAASRERPAAERRAAARKGASVLGAVLSQRAPQVPVTDELVARPDGSHLRVRVHDPVHSKDRPALLHIHGGGFVLGAPEDNDRHCARLAHEVGMVVVSVDYRLAPEHPFPAGIDDVMLALDWLVSSASRLRIDPERIGLKGESAGGNLAAVAALRWGNNSPAIRAVVLEVPVVDLTATLPRYDTMALFNDMFAAELIWGNEQYAAGRDLTDPSLSPALAPDLSGLPPTFVLVCDCDPLARQELEFVERLRAAGVQATAQVYPGLTHGFTAMTRIFKGAREAEAAAIAALRSELVALPNIRKSVTPANG